VRSLRDLDLGALWQQRPDGNLQSPPSWVHDTDRPISPLRAAKDLQGSTTKRVKGVEDLNIRIYPRSGYCGRGCHHPHVHCIVPGGGPSADGTRWIGCRPGFFLPVKVLSRLYRRVFLTRLQAAFHAGQPASLAIWRALGRLRQATVRRTRADARVSRPIYPSRRRLLAVPEPAPPAPAADYRERYQQLTGRSLGLCPGCAVAA
jgi:hypothetical protein